ncbi:unnamed protein product [Didymodactylos carnosus]|uniref:Uncharacterized protein n=1 Tax=Didymodactylos carnosus TaxID=1234261 RepID=A0A814UU89_9BILA|nr:unnamed protein product [Didymodactylos carnosus]CAF3943461.1 unnamed protein product [Didymodactylos carnosus]
MVAVHRFSTLVGSPKICRHTEDRKFAAENYLNKVNKGKKTYDDHMKTSSVVYQVGDCVGVRIDKVDRTNTDAKILPCIILSKFMKNNSSSFQLACEFGKVSSSFDIESLIDLRTAIAR